MSPGKRITKKQMKEDKLVTSAFKTSEYIQKNPKPFIIGGAAVSIVFIAVILFMWNADKKNLEAERYLVRAQIANDSGLLNDAIIDLKTVIDNYSNTQSAGQACFLLANIFFENKNYEEALRYFKKMVSDYPQDNMKAGGSAAGAAACHEELGDRGEAGRYYQMAANINPVEMWAPGYLLEAGRNFTVAGDLELARSAYNEIINSFNNSREINAAKRSLAEISF